MTWGCMGDDAESPRSGDGRLVERGNTYDHDQHGRVEVTGIWRGIEEVDEARNTNEKDVIIVRYSCERDEGERVDELTDTLPEFLEAIE